MKIVKSSINILPPNSEVIKILHISDLHLTPKRKRRIKKISSLSSLGPDLVVATGDFLAHNDAVPVVLESLSSLLQFPGLFVFGSNDYFAPTFKNPFRYLIPDNGTRKLGPELPWNNLEKGLSSGGWINLNTQKQIIQIKGNFLEVRGTDDAHLDRDNYSLVKGGKSKDVDISIGVTHAPYERVLRNMAEDEVDIIFAGHTHGGQVRLPWFGGSKALTTNCDLPLWRSRGLTRVDSEPWLNVSAGIGTSPFVPIRVMCPSEVSLIELRSIK